MYIFANIIINVVVFIDEISNDVAALIQNHSTHCAIYSRQENPKLPAYLRDHRQKIGLLCLNRPVTSTLVNGPILNYPNGT